MSFMDFITINIDSIVKDLNIEVISSDRRYWLVRAGKEGKFFEEFYGRGFTGIGYGINNLEILKTSTKEQLKELIKNNFPNEKQPGHIATKIYNFIHEIKKGDVIVMPSAGRKTVAFGIVDDDEVYLDNSFFIAESLEAMEEEMDIPDKRRKVKWLKNIESKFLQSKLILNLFSPHGLSGIADLDIIKLIDVNINDFFLKEEDGYLSFQVNSEKQINLNALSNLMTVLTEISSLYLNEEQQLSIQINLNSPGKIVVYGTKVTLVGALVILALFGGKFKHKGEKEEYTIETSGLYQYYEKTLEHEEKMAELNIKYLEAVNQLNIEEPEKIKLIREKK